MHHADPHVYVYVYDVKVPNCALEDVNFISLSVLGYDPKKFNTRRVRLHLTK